MLLATQNSPRVTKHKNNWLIRSRNTSNHNMAGTHLEERQSQRVKSTDGWIGGTRRETKGTQTEEKQPCVQHGTQEKSVAEIRWIYNTHEAAEER